MKKIIALILAIVMIASMSVVAFAAPIVDDDGKLGETLGQGVNRPLNPDDEAVDVIYDVRLGYEVIIPGTFNLEEVPNDDGTTHGTGSGLVIITLAKLPGNHELTVKATSANEKISGSDVFGNWTLAVNGTNDKLAYKIAVAGDNSGKTSYNTNDLGREEATNTIVSHKSGYDPAVTPYDADEETGGRRATLTITTAANDVAGYFQDVITFKTAVTAPTNA